MSELEEVRIAQESNYQEATRALDGAAALTQDILDLYETLVKLAEEGPAKVRAKEIYALSFLVTCKYELTMASLAIMRGHLLASYSHTRRAMELCALAVRVAEVKDFAELWVNAGNSDADYDRYRNMATTSRLFPKKHPLTGRFRDRYDSTSKLIHPSLYSLAQQAQYATGPPLTVRIAYFQLQPDDPTEPLQTFLWTMDTHFGILLAFEQVLKRLVANDPTPWAVRRNGVDGKLGAYKARLRAIVDALKNPRKSLLIWTP
jgi:hypothetical protein